MITPFQLKALQVLKDTSYMHRMSAREFAELMWPDSKMHTKVSNQGNGACKGKAAWLVGGSYLRKLEKKGWLWWREFGYWLSDAGKKVLNENS